MLVFAGIIASGLGMDAAGPISADTFMTLEVARNPNIQACLEMLDPIFYQNIRVT